MAHQNLRRCITDNDIQFVHNWIRQNLETMPGYDTPFSETYEDYCSSCLSESVTPVAKNSFGPAILKEFPNSFPNPKNCNRRTIQYYHNIVRRQRQPHPFSSFDSITASFGTNSTGSSFGSINVKNNNSNNRLLSPNNANHNVKMTSSQEIDFLCNGTIDNRNDESTLYSFPHVSLAPSSSLSMTIRTASSLEYTGTQDYPDVKNNNIITSPSYIRNGSDETLQVPPLVPSSSPRSPAVSNNANQQSSLAMETECNTTAKTVIPIIQNDRATTATFFRSYERYCDDMLHLLQMEQFHAIEKCIVSFHRGLLKEFGELIHGQTQEITESICQWDSSFYETITASMYSTMSHSPITNGGLISALETYTKQLNIYLDKALEGYPISLRNRKTEVARDFASAMYRHIKLTQLAELAATSLDQDEDFLKYIQAFWKNTDISFIIDHASRYRTNECGRAQIKAILIDEVGNLLLHYSDKAGLQQWISQMEVRIEDYMDSKVSSEREDVEFYRFCGDRFILIWTFYTTRILEEVTLTKTKHLGKFNELVLFLNELIQFLIDSSATKMTRNM
ncbi:hypothetical protein BDA99DRAFT_525303 [Phascolomyces articulosus]|uniref:Uncharacterized protein n=1 Tax=Phascolomyces articulosus TaxID=60185 RepID=A0AAD5K0G7_9FUNG|nr:hypothetical protein BDA99DRAFT_525303 [Phascolomyces articulosus]